jgi:hypothetical protein
VDESRFRLRASRTLVLQHFLDGIDVRHSPAFC